MICGGKDQELARCNMGIGIPGFSMRKFQQDTKRISLRV